MERPIERHAALRRLARETRELAASMETPAARAALLRSADDLDALVDALIELHPPPADPGGPSAA
jgi:hypothetical protein